MVHNDLLNALSHISLNEPPMHNKEGDSSLNKVTDIYVSKHHYKGPKRDYDRNVSNSASTQTNTIEFLSDSICACMRLHFS